MNTLRIITRIFFVASLCAFLAPICVHAGGLRDLLRPDYRKIYDPNKEFQGREYNSGREFLLKNFPGEKIVEKPSFRAKDFSTRPAAAETQKYPDKDASAAEQKFGAGDWPKGS